VDPQNLYVVFKPLSLFTADLDLVSQDHAPARVSCSSDTVADLTITAGFTNWDRSPKNSFLLASDGSMSPDLSGLGRYVFGQYHSELRNPPTFQVQSGAPATFTASIASVADSGGRLRILVDGVAALDQAVQQDTAYSVVVPAGSHAILVDNDGLDWIEIPEYTLSGAYPALRSFAMQSPDQLFGWAENRNYNWKRVLAQGLPGEVIHGQIQIDAVPDRTWTLDWYSCATGEKLSSEAVVSTGGQLRFPVPAFTWDLAYRIY